MSVAVGMAFRSWSDRMSTLLHVTRTPEWVERFVAPIKSAGAMATDAPATTPADQLAATSSSMTRCSTSRCVPSAVARAKSHTSRPQWALHSFENRCGRNTFGIPRKVLARIGTPLPK